MYGYEASYGLGGLAAQAPGGNMYLNRAMSIRSPGAMIVGDPTSPGANVLPYSLGAGLGSGGPPQISWGGGAVEQSAGQQLGSWREILDPHNSPALWILILVLLIYGYVHVSYRRGRVRGAVGV